MTRPPAEAMKRSCAGVPPAVNGFELAGLPPVDGVDDTAAARPVLRGGRGDCFEIAAAQRMRMTRPR